MKTIKALFITLIMGTFVNLTSYSQCGNDHHSNADEDNWLSCTEEISPNPARGSGHWILYDFGYNYELSSMYVWNYNVAAHTNRGIKDVYIDYSVDGNTWTELAYTQFQEADGTNSYSGFYGPDFNGEIARYVLITVISNWGDPSCSGLAEIRFDIINTIDIDEIKNDESLISVYPNPVDDVLYLNFGALIPQELFLNNAGGNKLLHLSGKEIKSMIDVSYLPAGLYLITVFDNKNKAHLVKFVKL